MGSRGPTKKRNQNPSDEPDRSRSVLELARPAGPPPEPYEHWSETTVSRWTAYWSDEVSRLAVPATRPMVYRLFDIYEQMDRYRAVVLESPVVDGPGGRIVENPLATRVTALEKQALRIEAELGLTPLARLRLGLTLADARADLQELYEHSSTDEKKAAPKIVSASGGDLASS